MRVLVFGAGILGSLLAHELHKTRHEVSVLARGRRLQDLKEHGLVIEHIKQRKRTVDEISVVEKLEPDDEYDIIFVALRKCQIDQALPVLAENTKCKHIVFIGNNCRIEDTHEQMVKKSCANPKILFGFLSCAGYKDEEVVYNWHLDYCDILLGEYKYIGEWRGTMKTVFSATQLEPIFKKNINAWLKHHTALIVPLGLTIQREGGADRALRKSEALTIAIEAIKELIYMLLKQGIENDPPQRERVLNWSTKKWQWLLSRMLASKAGQVMVVGHALSALDEMDILTKELFDCAKEYEIRLPVLNELYSVARGTRIS